ncbi:hypothetical protein BM1_10009 [Bipolaris maydis]|nr:hypothetical protein BM1_10009 [Bipolaris maydis]
MALVASKNIEKITSEDHQTHIGKANANTSGGEEDKRYEGKREDLSQRGESSSASSGSGPSHSTQRTRNHKIAPKSNRDATHDDDSDPFDWDPDAESFVDRDGQPVIITKPQPTKLSDDPAEEKTRSEAAKAKRAEEEEEEKKEIMAEEADRQRLLAQGREENRKKRHGGSNIQRPPSIERQWRQLYITVKTWWGNHGKPLSRSQKAPIQKIQERIEKECERIVKENYSDAGDIEREKKSLLKEYRFPVETLHGLISTAATALHDVQELEQNGSEKEKEALAEEQESLVKGVAVMTEFLKEHQIPAQCVVTQHAREMFDTIVNRNEKTRTQYVSTIEELNRPTSDQQDAWTIAVPEMRKALNVIDIDDRTSAGAGKLQTHIDAMESQNTILERQNTEQGIEATTNSLPLAFFQRMQQQWINGEQEKLNHTRTDLIKMLKSQSLAKSLDPSLLKQTNGKMEAMEYSSDPLSTTEPSLTESSIRSPPSTGVKETPSSSGRLANSKPEYSAKEKDYLSMQFGEVDVIKMPDYSDGKTEFGDLVATRLCRTGNPRFSRFILRAGTEKSEHYQVIRGSDLGPGGAEALQDYDDGSSHFTFDLWKRKKELKTNRIGAIGPCVVMCRAEDYKPRSRTRRPDTYVKIMYIDNTIDWVTRTEMIELVGKTFAEKKLAILEEGYKEKTKFLEAHKKAGIHPDTKQPLDPKDYGSTPWLFLEGRLPGGIDAKSTDNEEDQDGDMMEGIEIRL